MRTPGCRFGPHEPSLATWADAETNFLDGLLPPQPLIGPGSRVMAIGSCFARSIAGYLRAERPDLSVNAGGDDVGLIFFGGGFVTTHTMLWQLRWAFGEVDAQGDATLYAETTRSTGTKTLVPVPATESARRSTRRAVQAADVFIVTLGLAEVWEDAQTGNVFFKAVPRRHYDPTRHRFRLTTVQENKANLEGIVRLLRKAKPDAPIVLTLSPVPLTATFRSRACLVANAASKAILRAAVEEFMLTRPTEDPPIYYWPSYELVTEHFAGRAMEENRRHVKREVVRQIMGLFERHYCAPRPARGA